MAKMSSCDTDTLRLLHLTNVFGFGLDETRTYLRHKELSIDVTEAAFYGGAGDDAKTWCKYEND